MIECTLAEAVKRCREDGGTFYRKDASPQVKYYNNNGTICELTAPANKFYLLTGDFDQTWIYEPLKQSAFQEWNKAIPPKSTVHVFESDVQNARKEGWNAAIDAVLKNEIGVVECDGARSTAGMISTEIIKALKEP